MSVERQLLEELRRDEELRRAPAEELLPEALRHRELRRAMLVALSREVATKEDVENLRRATKEDIESLGRAIKALEERVSSLEQMVARVEGQLSLLVKAFIAFNLPTLIGIIGILLRTYMPPPP
jgi:septal ring factor EnvC (AmiA/AmiB activator)